MKSGDDRKRRRLSYLAWGAITLGAILYAIFYTGAAPVPDPTPVATQGAALPSPSPSVSPTPSPSTTPVLYRPLFDSPIGAATPTLAGIGSPTVIETSGRPATRQPTMTRRPTQTPTPAGPTATPPFRLHTVKPDESLITIASAYGTSTEALVIANEIRDPTSLEVGQKLVIPPQRGLETQVHLHRVQPADTLMNIAAKYGSSVNAILAVNPHLKPPSLPVGQTVAVPVVFKEAKPTPLPEQEEDAVIYTVQSGDIPLTIAHEFEIPVELLLAANEIVDPTLLQIGQQLVIPPADGVTLGVPIVLYELARGDSLLGIATRFGSSIKDILAVNPDLSPASLAAGQTVAIPIIFAPMRPTPDPNAPARPRPAPVNASPALASLQAQMIELVNGERVAEGLPPYQKDQEMTEMAVAHARDMVERSYLSHITPEGVTLRDRFAAQGIEGVYRVGEDIQRNTKPRAETVTTALNWFMGSRPHRNNILHHQHNRIGVGIVEGPPGWFTFVLVFAQR